LTGVGGVWPGGLGGLGWGRGEGGGGEGLAGRAWLGGLGGAWAELRLGEGGWWEGGGTGEKRGGGLGWGLGSGWTRFLSSDRAFVVCRIFLSSDAALVIDGPCLLYSIISQMQHHLELPLSSDAAPRSAASDDKLHRMGMVGQLPRAA
jgi:hypothetical protein